MKYENHKPFMENQDQTEQSLNAQKVWVIDLMKSSKSEEEWNANCDKVKKAFGGYPDFWYKEVILTGLANQVLGAGAGDIKITAF